MSGIVSPTSDRTLCKPHASQSRIVSRILTSVGCTYRRVATGDGQRHFDASVTCTVGTSVALCRNACYGCHARTRGNGTTSRDHTGGCLRRYMSTYRCLVTGGCSLDGDCGTGCGSIDLTDGPRVVFCGPCTRDSLERSAVSCAVGADNARNVSGSTFSDFLFLSKGPLTAASGGGSSTTMLSTSGGCSVERILTMHSGHLSRVLSPMLSFENRTCDHTNMTTFAASANCNVTGCSGPRRLDMDSQGGVNCRCASYPLC